MVFNLNIDQEFCLALGLKPTNAEAYVLSYLTKAATWAEPIQIKKQTWYFVSRTKVVADLPWISRKPDTIYRYFTALADKNLIEYQKMGKYDCIRLEEVCQFWGKAKGEEFLGHLSEHSDRYPGALGQVSEFYSDRYPTYYSIILDNSIKDTKGDFPKSPPTQPEAGKSKKAAIPEDVAKLLEDSGDKQHKLWTRLTQKTRKYIPQVLEVVSYYNEITGTSTKPYTVGVYDNVVRWLKEGHTLEDFKDVLNYKYWYFTEKMPEPSNINLETWLRPKRFEGNLERAKVWKQQEAPVDLSKATNESYINFVQYVSKSELDLQRFIPTEAQYVDYLERNSGNQAGAKSRLVAALNKLVQDPRKYSHTNLIDLAEGAKQFA
jgi:uncharacterized phage protein (TIGR02220 family)